MPDRVEEHRVGIPVGTEPVDMFPDETADWCGDGHDSVAFRGLRLVEPVFAQIVRTLRHGMPHVQQPVVEVDVPELQSADLSDAQPAHQQREMGRQTVVFREALDQRVDLLLVIGACSRLLDGLFLVTRLHGFEDNSGGPPSGCRSVAALITRLSSQTACSSAEGRTSSHAFAYHSLTNSSVMSHMGVSPNQVSSLSNAAFWIRLLLPLSSPVLLPQVGDETRRV